MNVSNQKRHSLLVVGCGSLSNAIVLAIAQLPFQIDVWVTSRNKKCIEELCMVANLRASEMGCKFYPHQLNLANQAELDDLFNSQSFDIVLQTASQQSAWNLQRENDWSILVNSAGYGLTTSIQALITSRICIAARHSISSPLVLNACYPDLVNALLCKAGYSVSAGIGNIAFLYRFLRHTLKLKKLIDLHILGGHFNVIEFQKHPNHRHIFPRIWIDGEEQCGNWAERISQRLPSGPIINHMVAQETALLLSGLFSTNESYTGHLPGVAGTIGGGLAYISFKNTFIINPPSLDKCEAQCYSGSMQILDGATMSQNKIIYNERAESALREYSSELASGFMCQDFASYAKALLDLRERLGGS